MTHVLKGAMSLFIASMLLGAALPVSAASLTSNQISAILGLLQSFGADAAVIATVQASLNGTPGGFATPAANANPSCAAISMNLASGSQNADVAALQKFLAVDATGYFGPQTKLALQRWQTTHGIPATGTVGPVTLKAIGCSVASPAPISNVSDTPKPPEPKIISLLDSQDHYQPRTTPKIEVGTIYDIWGERFLIRLDSLVNNTARFTSLFDPLYPKSEFKPSGQFEVALGQTTQLKLTVTNQDSAGIETYTYPGQITLQKIPATGVGEFEVVMDIDGPQLTSTTGRVQGPVSTQTLPVEYGLATLQVKAGAAPFEAQLLGEYNVLKLCNKQVQYYLDFGDGANETFVSNSCSPTPYRKVHTYKPGVYAAYISLYQVSNGNWSYFEQARVLITVSVSGGISTKIMDVSTLKKG